jgi:hypothetical protein
MSLDSVERILDSQEPATGALSASFVTKRL